MRPLTKQKYFYYIAFMLIASSFLPLVFNNLPPIIRSHHVWTVIWLISLLVFNPQIFLNRSMVYVLFYGILLIIARETIWYKMDGWNFNSLILEYYEIFIGISVITYFNQSKDFLGLALITKWAIVFLLITAVMSIISSAIDPMYARNIIGISGVVDEGEREAILSFKQYGGGTYSTAAAFMCLFPVIIYYYKNIQISLISKEKIIICSIILFLALFGMQIFGNILIAVVFSTIGLLGMKKIKQTMIVLVLFFTLILLIPRQVYVNSFISLSGYFKKDSELNYKFTDLASFIETGSDAKDNSTGVAGRVERFPMLMETFLKSPGAGCFYFSDGSESGYNGDGMHLYWMNKLTITGILGFLAFFFILYNFVKSNMKHFNETYNFYYILASLAIISYGVIKVIGGRDTWYAFFIILPGLYYLPLLKKEINNSYQV